MWRLATNFKVLYYNQLHWSVDRLKTNEKMREAGLAAPQVAKIKPSSILGPGYVEVRCRTGVCAVWILLLNNGYIYFCNTRARNTSGVVSMLQYANKSFNYRLGIFF